MKETIKLAVLRKEMKLQKGTFFQCVNFLFSYDNCPQLKKILPASKNKAKTDEHEKAAKEFVKFGQTLTRKVTKLVDGERCVAEIQYIKNSFSVDEVLRYFLSVYNKI